MAIQFHCPGCGQPIEVDDIYASKSAACPYCRRVVNVPEATAGDFAATVTARPGGGATPNEHPTPSPAYIAGDGLHVGPSATPREIAARRFGNYALICAILAVLLFGSIVVYSVSLIPSDVLHGSASGFSPERMEELQKKIGETPWVIAANLGMLVFAVLGTILAIVSLTQRRAKNWRAIVALVICGVFVLCTCSAVLLSAAAGAAGAAS